MGEDTEPIRPVTIPDAGCRKSLVQMVIAELAQPVCVRSVWSYCT
jgi:hypothetical protein